MLHITKKDVDKMAKKLNYQGCKNCEHQISPLRMCEWAENGGDGHLHFICPMWREKEGKLNDNKVQYR